MAPVRIGSLINTGAGGERPEPPYPPIALQTGEQGTVVLLLSGDDAGNVVSVDVKESSGFPVLDRATVDFIKHHWRLPGRRRQPAFSNQHHLQTAIELKPNKIMLANIVLQFFLKGGPVMWPILVCAIVAVAVVGERAFWWWRESQKRDPQKMEQLLAALENSDVPPPGKSPPARTTRSSA